MLNVSPRSSPGARERRAVLRRAFLDSIPVMMGYLSMGFVAGVLLAAKANLAHPVLWAPLTALSMSGTFNFAIVLPVADRMDAWSVAALVAAVNFRYFFYGFAMIGRWKGMGPARKIFLVHALADENFALESSCRYKDPSRFAAYCTALSAMNLSYWVAGVTAGAASVAALAGAVDPDSLRRATRGMEFAMVALFIVILADWLKEALQRYAK